MKKTKRAVSLLIAVILVFGMATAVSAAVPAKKDAEFSHYGVVYGLYPVFSDAGYAAVNNAIQKDLMIFFAGFSTLNVQNISGAFNGGSYTSIDVSPIKDDDGFISFTISVSRKFPDKAYVERHEVGKYVINTTTKAMSTQAALDAHLKAQETGGPPIAVVIPPQPTFYEQIMAAYDTIKAIPIITDSEGYVSLKKYADAFNGEITFNESTGNIDFIINRQTIMFDIDPAIWSANPHVKINAPIYLVGDDILVHATLIYPIYNNAKISVNANGVVLIAPK